MTARDTEIVLGELLRLGRISERLLILASSTDPGFLMLERVSLGDLVASTAERWSAAADRAWIVDASERGVVLVDRERIDCAVDALVENADQGDGPCRADRRARVGRGRRAGDRDLRPRCRHRAPATASASSSASPASPTTDNGKQGGTGLGLPMARAIATAHGGAVTLRSEPRGWTTFELRLRTAWTAGDVPSRPRTTRAPQMNAP